MPKKCHCSQFFCLHNCWSLFLDFTGGCYQEWNNLGGRAISADNHPRLTRNIIFTKLLTVNYRFCDSGYVIICLQPRSTTDGYLSCTAGHHFKDVFYVIFDAFRIETSFTSCLVIHKILYICIPYVTDCKLHKKWWIKQCMLSLIVSNVWT